MGSIFDAAKTGYRLEALTELRNKLAERLDKCNSDRDLAALSRQFMQVTAEIEEIKGSTEIKAASLDDFRSQLRAVK